MMRQRLSVSLAIGLLSLGACAHSSNVASSAPSPNRDPRVGLRAGWMDAAQAAWNLRLVSTTPPSHDFLPATPGDFRFINSDLSFDGKYVIQGNFSGYQVWDISDPSHPTLHTAYVCPGSQSDVSVYRNFLFVSDEAPNGRTDCGTQGVADTVSHDRARGIRIFEISDIAHPKPITIVQTCRGSHTHTIVTDPHDSANVYIYVSGSAPVRSPTELAGCSSAQLDQDSASALFRIEVIQVPLAAPEKAHIVSSPRIFADLLAPATHPEAPQDVAAAAKTAADARAKGAFTAKLFGLERVLPPALVQPMLDSIARVRQGTVVANGVPTVTPTPTSADSAALRGAIQGILDKRFFPLGPNGVRLGPTQCHDITVYPAIGLAGGACEGYGFLLDIRDPAHPKRIAAVSDSNFSYWHSATFDNDGTKVLFTDEWGGGLAPRCRVTDKPEWGADALFTLVDNRMAFQSYYKLPAPQTATENCVAHNGSLIPVPGRDIMAQGWYQGGVSVFDWTDPAHPKEIAFFDRGPMDSTKLEGAGSWSAYWYNGYIVSSEIARGLDILELQPSAFLSQNEIDAAKLVHFDFLNVQDQPKFVWPASFVVARAYLDQLARSNGLAPARVAAARDALARAEKLSGPARRDALTQLATQLNGDASSAADGAKVRTLAATVTGLANAEH
jgi:hypothetical protein